MWTLSAGTIESGQGTPSIVVDTVGFARASNVTATVSVHGLSPAYNTTSSETTSIESIPEGDPFDSYEKRVWMDEMAISTTPKWRLDGRSGKSPICCYISHLRGVFEVRPHACQENSEAFYLAR